MIRNEKTDLACGRPRQARKLPERKLARRTNFYLRMLLNTNKNESQLSFGLRQRIASRLGDFSIRNPWTQGRRQQEQKSLSRSAFSPDRAPDSHTSVQPGPGHHFPGRHFYGLANFSRYRAHSAPNVSPAVGATALPPTSPGDTTPAVRSTVRERARNNPQSRAGPSRRRHRTCVQKGTVSAGIRRTPKCNDRVVKP